jgi:hypothetical protein
MCSPHTGSVRQRVRASIGPLCDGVYGTAWGHVPLQAELVAALATRLVALHTTAAATKRIIEFFHVSKSGAALCSSSVESVAEASAGVLSLRIGWPAGDCPGPAAAVLPQTDCMDRTGNAQWHAPCSHGVPLPAPCAPAPLPPPCAPACPLLKGGTSFCQLGQLNGCRTQDFSPRGNCILSYFR